jgi:probable HAF family extracellular repeat protein
VRNLNDMLVGQSRWRLLSAYGINDKGQIVGFGLPSKANPDVKHAFLLTPVAETE